MKNTHGATLDSAALASLLSWLFDVGDRRPTGLPAPVCIWGAHGLGKTTLVEDLARQKGWKYAFCSPAQFEEMGDLHGLPVLREGRTAYAPPTWVPDEDGPGLLLLDDVNRADDRILRGLMPLLLTGGLLSWRLPRRWQIVLTANPEGGDYSVTPMDPAMVDRMVHFTLTFDAKAWARWATGAGVDPRGISFVLLYPEIVGGRTTPRALVRFFELIAPLPDLRAELDRVWWLGRATLDETAVAAFVAFVRENLSALLEPDELLEAGEELGARLDHVGRDGATVRVDRLAAVGTRVVLHVSRPDYTPGPTHGANLVRFLLHRTMPADLRLSLHRDLLASGAQVAALLRDPKLAAAILEGS